jgi:hypothetical protein
MKPERPKAKFLVALALSGAAGLPRPAPRLFPSGDVFELVLGGQEMTA